MSYAERADRFDADLAAAVAAVDIDSQLIALLGRPQIDDRERILITAALGESGTGPDGSAAVRAQFSDAMARLATVTKSARSGWRDLACAAVIALARRDGPAATDIYLTAAGCTSAAVRDYGLMVLAAEGDERAWDPMLATVSEILRRKRISYGRWYDMLHAVQYLARHAARGTERAEQLISLLRANWGTLARPPQKLVNRGPYVEPEMQTATRLEELWPGIQPDGPPGNAIDLPRLHTPITDQRPNSASSSSSGIDSPGSSQAASASAASSASSAARRASITDSGTMAATRLTGDRQVSDDATARVRHRSAHGVTVGGNITDGLTHGIQSTKAGTGLPGRSSTARCAVAGHDPRL